MEIRYLETWQCYDYWYDYFTVVSRGAVRSAASSYAAMRMVAGSRPDLVIAWEWHIGLALLCGCSGALEYPTTNSCGPINKSLSLCVPHLFMRAKQCNKGYKRDSTEFERKTIGNNIIRQMALSIKLDYIQITFSDSVVVLKISF